MRNAAHRRGADELRQHWLDPRTLPQIMAGFATVHATGDGRMHWKVEGPLDMGADFCNIQPGDTVAVRGCGGVGLMPASTR